MNFIFRHFSEETQKLYKIANRFSKVNASILFLSYIPLIFLTMSDAPVKNSVAYFFLTIPAVILLTGLVISTLFEYKQLKSELLGLNIQKIILTILSSWILGPINLAIVLFFYWFIVTGFNQLVFGLYYFLHNIGLF